MVADDFKRIHADFRAAWVEHADAPFTLELFSPSLFDSRKPPFDWSEWQHLGDVRLPFSESRQSFTMMGFLFVAKESHTVEVTKRFQQISAEAGAALPISIRDHLVGYCPWDVGGPANWWYALLFHLQGAIARNPDGSYKDHTLLLRPLLMSLVAIEYCGLVGENPCIPSEDGVSPADASRESQSSSTPKDYSAIQAENDAMLTSPHLAEMFNVPAEALRKRLERWRKKHDEGWTENLDRRSNQPQFIYRVGDVRPIIEEMLKDASD